MAEGSFKAHGRPTPQGSKKNVAPLGQRARLVEVSAGNKQWRKTVAAACAAHYDGPPNTAPVLLELDFQLLRPKTVRRLWPTVRPDLDKLCRSVLDGLTDGGLLADDSIVISLLATKSYCDSPVREGVFVNWETLDT